MDVPSELAAAYARATEATKAMTAAQEVFWDALAEFDEIQQVGWWSRNCVDGRVHDHTHNTLTAYHRLCVPVFVRL